MSFRRSMGLSLIEWLVVVAILAILFGVGTPNYLRWRASEQTREGAQQVARAIDSLRTSSRKVDTSVSINIPSNATQFSITDSSGTRSVILPQGTVFGTSAGTISLNFEPPYGTLQSVPAAGFSEVEVEWASDTSISATVVVAGVMGRAYVR